MNAVDTGYRYEFGKDEIDAIKACHDAHGFAIVKDVITPDYVEELKTAVRAAIVGVGGAAAGGAAAVHGLVEHTAVPLQLLQNEPYLRICRALVGSEAITINRAAAIQRNPGAAVVTWHTDWSFNTGAPQIANDILNRGEYPSGLWFYLNGSHPERGGLAIIADSHKLDWTPPPGFALMPGRGSFHRIGEAVQPYDRMDVPGMVPIIADPTDFIIFAARTYHAAYPHLDSEPRLSVGINFRPTVPGWAAPWTLSPSAQRLKESVPAALYPFVEQYPGFDRHWRAA